MSAPTMSSTPHLLTLEEERLRAVLLGDPGVGKTTLAATFPRPLFVDCEGGLISVALDGTKALTWQPQGYRDMEGFVFWARDNAKAFDTIVIDTLDGLVRILLNEVTDQGKDKAKTFITEMVPEQAEYLTVQRQIERILHTLRLLGKHLVCTVAVQVKDGSTKRTLALSPGLSAIVNRWSSLTGDLVKTPLEEGGEDKRVLIIEQSNKRDSKSRFAKAIGVPYLVEPTFQTIWSPIEAAYKQNEVSK